MPWAFIALKQIIGNDQNEENLKLRCALCPKDSFGVHSVDKKINGISHGKR